MRDTWLLGKRAVAEIWKLPAATLPTLFIPLFFLAVNIGQVSSTYTPDKFAFLEGQAYAAFQLPVTMVFATSTATSGLALVTDIDLGYLDKLLLAPIRRYSIVLGRLLADFVRGVLVSILVLALGLAFGVEIRSGVLGAVVLVLLASLWGVAYAGFAQLIALRTRNVQTTNASFILFFPLLFLTPNFVPFEFLKQPMRAMAQANPVSYIIVGLRSLVLEGWQPRALLVCVATIVVTAGVLTALSLRTLRTYGD